MKDLIDVDKNEIIFGDLSKPNVVSDFIVATNKMISAHEKNIILNFKNVNAAFPNVCVPLVGIIEHLRAQGFNFEFYYLSDYCKNMGIKEAWQVGKNKEVVRSSCLNKIWRFDCADDIYLLINAFSEELSKIIVCEKGILEGFEWSINEVLDNVLQHSGKTYGYVIGQVHQQSKHFAFCVYDTGQGIYKSLQSSSYHPQTPADALKLAVQEGVTRDKKVGQGNGLWGLHQIVSENTGSLNITSNAASYRFTNTKAQIIDNLPQLLLDNDGCIVDFQIDYSKAISISNALGGYEPVNTRMENLENDKGDICIDLHAKETGVGTRQSGEKIRNEVINIYKQTNKSITLDFSQIKIISSSFADELIGKLVAEFGFYGFNNIIKLKNMNVNVQSIVQRSVAQRMMESFQ